MDASSSRPGSPAIPGGPLQMATPDRVNQCRDSIFASLRTDSRDNSVHDKISQFNNLSVTMQSKQLERKTADAALKRAMLGREEAEGEMRRVKDEMKMLRKAIDEGKDRERRVGERLETVMENYGRAKETHAHTQALWEKEVRRARKENFKGQSTIVKLQEELKTARTAVKIIEENLEREKERSHIREQEAFEARYQIVGVQEQLEQALEQIKLAEQERDAYKAAAKNEEVARLAAEGRLPLPRTDDPNDEFASPKKMKKTRLTVPSKLARVSLSTMDIVSSAASELEIDQLNMEVQWEKQRADRAQEMIEFMQAECLMHLCPCSKSKRRTSMLATKQVPRDSPEVATRPVENPNELEEEEDVEEPNRETTTPVSHIEEPHSEMELHPPKARRGPRRSTIFCATEGIFRTVSEQEAAIHEAQQKADAAAEAEEETETDERLKAESQMDIDMEPPMPLLEEEEEEDYEEEELGREAEVNARMFARTPSVEPPAFALLAQERTSLLSLINAPRGEAHTDPLPTIHSIPTIADTEPDRMSEPAQFEPQMTPSHEDEMEEDEPESLPRHSHERALRPHTSAAGYTVTTTTTVPVRDSKSGSSFGQRLRTPSTSSNASFDLTNPALTPTMTREQALAKIRERRGRARSAAQTAASSGRRIVKGVDRRDMSAPTGKVTKVRRS